MPDLVYEACPSSASGHLEVLRHLDLFERSTRLGQKIARQLAIARPVAIEQHTRIPAADFGLLDATRHLVGRTSSTIRPPGS